jgi:hypothetical protein
MATNAPPTGLEELIGCTVTVVARDGRKGLPDVQLVAVGAAGVLIASRGRRSFLVWEAIMAITEDNGSDRVGVEVPVDRLRALWGE